MNGRLITSIAVASSLALASAAEPGWVNIDATPLDWPDALPLLTQQRSAFVLDTPSATHLRGFLPPSLRKPGPTEPQIRAQVVELCETLPAKEKVDLKIKWLSGDEQPADFTRSMKPAEGFFRSSYRLGGTGITPTVIAVEEETLQSGPQSPGSGEDLARGARESFKIRRKFALRRPTRWRDSRFPPRITIVAAGITLFTPRSSSNGSPNIS